MFRRIVNFVLAAAAVLPLASLAQAQAVPEIKLGYAKCAHCTPLSLTPQNAANVKLEAIGFNTGNDVLTALLSKSIDVAQVTGLVGLTCSGINLAGVGGGSSWYVPYSIAHNDVSLKLSVAPSSRSVAITTTSVSIPSVDRSPFNLT